MVYATACCSNFPTGDGQFVPLTVNYGERFSAVGRTRFVPWGGDEGTVCSRFVMRMEGGGDRGLGY